MLAVVAVTEFPEHAAAVVAVVAFPVHASEVVAVSQLTAVSASATDPEMLILYVPVKRSAGIIPVLNNEALRKEAPALSPGRRS